MKSIKIVTISDELCHECIALKNEDKENEFLDVTSIVIGLGEFIHLCPIHLKQFYKELKKHMEKEDLN